MSDGAYWTLLTEDPLMVTTAGLAMGLLVFNLVVWAIARRKTDPRLVPQMFPPGDGMILQLAASVGTTAQPRRTFAETRLRQSIGLRILWLTATLGLAAGLPTLHHAGLLRPSGSVPWPELALLAIAVWQSVAAWTWELRYDPVGLSAPVMIVGRRTRLWRNLVAVTDDSPFTLRFHFADGAVIDVPKHVVGRRELLHLADHWIHRDREPPDARTARS